MGSGLGWETGPGLGLEFESGQAECHEHQAHLVGAGAQHRLQVHRDDGLGVGSMLGLGWGWD